MRLGLLLGRIVDRAILGKLQNDDGVSVRGAIGILGDRARSWGILLLTLGVGALSAARKQIERQRINDRISRS
jgi:sulfite exporter TauE/SafE